MKFGRSDTILKELREHLPFTLVVSLLAGGLVALGYVFGGVPSEGLFEVVHPLHVLVSAAATAGIFRKYKRSFVEAVLVGVVGAVLVGSISDVLLPWVAGNLFGLETVLHLPVFESPFLIFGGAVVGSFVGVSFGLFKLNHSLHVFLSVFASLFYLLGFSIPVSTWVVLGFSLVVFVVVYVPCCVSDIVFPILFVGTRKE
jgi:hypothetical protein